MTQRRGNMADGVLFQAKVQYLSQFFPQSVDAYRHYLSADGRVLTADTCCESTH